MRGIVSTAILSHKDHFSIAATPWPIQPTVSSIIIPYIALPQFELGSAFESWPVIVGTISPDHVAFSFTLLWLIDLANTI